MANSALARHSYLQGKRIGGRTWSTGTIASCGHAQVRRSRKRSCASAGDVRATIGMPATTADARVIGFGHPSRMLGSAAPAVRPTAYRTKASVLEGTMCTFSMGPHSPKLSKMILRSCRAGSCTSVYVRRGSKSGWPRVVAQRQAAPAAASKLAGASARADRTGTTDPMPQLRLAAPELLLTRPQSPCTCLLHGQCARTAIIHIQRLALPLVRPHTCRKGRRAATLFSPNVGRWNGATMDAGCAAQALPFAKRQRKWRCHYSSLHTQAACDLTALPPCPTHPNAPFLRPSCEAGPRSRPKMSCE